MTDYGSMPPTDISGAPSGYSAFTAPSAFAVSAAPSDPSAFSAFSRSGSSNAGQDTAVSESRPDYSSSSKYSQPGITYQDSSAAPTSTNGRRGGRKELHEIFDEDYLRSRYRQHQEIIGDDISYQDFRHLEDKTTVMYSDSEAPIGEGYK